MTSPNTLLYRRHSDRSLRNLHEVISTKLAETIPGLFLADAIIEDYRSELEAIEKAASRRGLELVG